MDGQQPKGTTGRELQGKSQTKRYWSTVLGKDGPRSSSSLPESSMHDQGHSTQRTRAPASLSVSGTPQGARHSQSQSRMRPGQGSVTAIIADVDQIRRPQSASTSTAQVTVCKECDTTFKRRYDYVQHVSAVHQKNRPFPCSLCGQKFAHKGTCSKHMRTVHLGERPFICEHCGQNFSERGNVNKHKQRSQACREAEIATKRKLWRICLLVSVC